VSLSGDGPISLSTSQTFTLAKGQKETQSFSLETGEVGIGAVTLSVEGPVRVFRNNTPKGRHWIAFTLEGDGANTFGLGARVEIVLGEERRWAEMRTSGGFQSSIPTEVHFGLGSIDKVDAVIVHWPDGKAQRIDAPSVDQRHRIPEDSTR